MFFIVLILSCSFDETETAQTTLELVLPSLSEGRSEIKMIRILIQSDQRTIPQQDFSMTPSPDSSGFQSLNIFIPLDAEFIRVEALGNYGEQLFVGESVLSMEREGISEIRVQLDPITPVLKFNLSSSFADVGEDFQIELELKHVRSLFALTLQIAYPDVFIEPYAVELGDFWQSADESAPVLMVSDYNLSAQPPGRLSLGFVRTVESSGDTESGKIATIFFHTKQTGLATIRVLENPQLTVQQFDGSPVDNFEELIGYLNRAQVQLEIR
ncbi:MAG: cohesin domain-containing protein [Candidatus Poribacteria bacterium]|nr:cohesin domain-containing protein [Candidatus Poribacteria bacterium]